MRAEWHLLEDGQHAIYISQTADDPDHQWDDCASDGVIPNLRVSACHIMEKAAYCGTIQIIDGPHRNVFKNLSDWMIGIPI